MPAVRSLDKYTGIPLPGVMNHAGPGAWELNFDGKYVVIRISDETIKVQRFDPKRGVRWWASQGCYKIDGSDTPYPSLTEARIAAAEYIQLVTVQSYDMDIPDKLDLEIDRSVSYVVDNGVRMATVTFSNGKVYELREVNYTTKWSTSLVPGLRYASKNVAISDTIAIVKYGCRVINPIQGGVDYQAFE